MRCRRHGLLAFASHAAAVLLPGAALHYLVERPFLQLREHRAGPDRRRRLAAAEQGVSCEFAGRQ